MSRYDPIGKALFFLIGAFLVWVSPTPLLAYPEHSAFTGNNCMVCHTGPTGGFGRRPLSKKETGWLTDKVYMSGDFLFLGLYDKRDGFSDRTVVFPMEGSLHFGFEPNRYATLAASQDFGIVRELYGMVHNSAKTAYIRGGWFTLPFGLLIPDHTAFIKEGRVEAGRSGFKDIGIGANRFGVRYKDSGVEAGLSGYPFFANISMTSGLPAQESRPSSTNQDRSDKAYTGRGGFIVKHLSLGGSYFTSNNKSLDEKIDRYGAFGWVSFGPFAVLFEHDLGKDEEFIVKGSTKVSASYVELVYAFKLFGLVMSSYAKVRYERLDPNRSLNNDELERWVYSYRFYPLPYLSIESFYRKNREKPIDLNNDEGFIITHFFF